MKYIVLIAAFLILFVVVAIGERQPPVKPYEEFTLCQDASVERVFESIPDGEIRNWDYLKYVYHARGGYKYDPSLQFMFNDDKYMGYEIAFDMPPPPPNEIPVTVRFFLQGYYLGNGLMRQAHDMIDGEIQPRWPMPISDLCTIRLTCEDDGSTLFEEQTYLSVDGYAHVLIPDSLCNELVYVHVLHRNHLQTVYFEPIWLCN